MVTSSPTSLILQAEDEMDTLPEIPKVKHSLVEAAGKKSTRSAPSFFADSGLDLSTGYSTKHGHSATATSSRTNSVIRPPSAGTFSPSPPISPLFKTATVSQRPHSPLERKSLEYVRVSRSELDLKEKTINSMRCENLTLQNRIRELEHLKESCTTLQSTCERLAQCLGCSTQGVAAESISDILTAKVNALTQENKHLNQQFSSNRTEFEQSKGELAAAKVKLSNMETQLAQARSELASKEAQSKQMRADNEELQQTSARLGASVQSLRQQLTEAEGRTAAVPSQASLTQLQTEVGRLKNELTKKDDAVKSLELQMAAKQAEKESIENRLTNSDIMCADLCTQLVMALGLETTDSFDTDFLISQVSSCSQELTELRLRVETMAKTINTAELDSKASRETILRLVSEVKRREQSVEQITQLQGKCDELKATILSIERERDSTQERLKVAKETLAAQEHELQEKDRRVVELSQTCHSLRLASSSEQSLAESAQLKYEELCKAIATLVGSQSTDSVVLLEAIQSLNKNSLSHSQRLAESSSDIAGLESTCDGLKDQLSKAEEALEEESSRVKRLEGELLTVDVVREGLSKELEKHKAFEKKMLKAVQLESSTAKILSGDFSHDAILAKAEQLAKHETQVLAERQTAMYSLQRKLKASKQALESKDLHLGLVQKKVTALEDRLRTYSHRESDWEDALDKVKRLEKQTERLQSRVAQQRDVITKLKEENSEVQKLKSHCSEQEQQLARLMANTEELTQTKVQYAQQLAEARGKVQSCLARDRSEVDKLKSELRTANTDLEKAKERERELCVFRTTVRRLVNKCTGSGREDSSSVNDFDVVARLEEFIALQQKHAETAKCLEASLRQLELGFKANYKDTLTLLSSDS